MREKGGKSLALSSHGHTIDSLPLMGIGNLDSAYAIVRFDSSHPGFPF